MFEFDVDRRKRHITYGEVYKEINEISPKLNNLLGNLKKDSLVGIYMTNSVLWIEIFWSILKCGFTPILLNVNLSNDRLKKVIKENNVNAVISDNSVDFEVKNIIASEIINSKDKEISNEFGKDVIFMSSGTTNNIKLCYFSPKQFIAQLSNTHAIVRKQPKIYYGYNHELKLLTFLPFYHVFGFFAVYLWFSFVGRTFVLLDKFTSENLFSTVKNHQVTHIFAVPLLWNLIYDGVIKKLKKDEKLYEKFNKALDLSNKINFKNIIINASRYYDQVFVDLRKGIRYQEQLDILNISDVIVANINQGTKEIEKFLSYFFQKVGKGALGVYYDTPLWVTCDV